MSHLIATLEDFEDYFKNRNISLKNKIMLDVGCKDSSNRLLFETMGLRWIGIDKKSQEPKDSQIEIQDMTDIKFSNDFFDIIFVCHSLEHCENPLKALREFNRILKQDGYLFISLPCPCSHHILESDEDHIFCFTLLQLQRLLIYIGFNKSKIHCWEGIIGKGYGNDKYNIYGITQK